MKYGKILIVLGAVNIFAIFSGLPTGWKKFIILGVSILVITIGWILRTIAQKRKERALAQVAMIEQEVQEEINDLAEEIVADVQEQVEDEIDRI
jgi:type VI protein secretion system component VasK